MKIRALFHVLALLVAGSTGGAAVAQVRETVYPSLAKRPIESRDFDAETRAAEIAANAEVAAAPEPALLSQLGDIGKQVDAGAGAFDSAYASTRGRVGAASGAAVSSEAWVDAQVALSVLEASRYPSVSALASLDTLYVERVDAVASGKAQGGVGAIDALRTKALGYVDSQNDRIDRLRASLKQP